MKSFVGKIVLITGGSSGIGAELARAFGREGASIAILARREDRLKILQSELEDFGTKCIAIRCDVTSEADLKNAVQQIHQTLGVIDIAIANAGYGAYGPVEQLDVSIFRHQFDTNVFGVVNTFYACLPDLKKSKGNFVIIGSAVGFISPPNFIAYSMTKYALRALAEGLQLELETAGIHTTYVAPSYVATEFQKVDRYGVVRTNPQIYAPSKRLSASLVAQKVVTAIRKNKREIIIGNDVKFVRLLGISSNAVYHVLKRLKFS